DGLAAARADPVGAVLHPGERAVDLAHQVPDVVLDGKVPFPLEREGAGVGVLLVERDLARDIRLRGGERGLLDGRQLHLRLSPFGLQALAQFVQFLLGVGDLPGHGRRNLASAAQGGNESTSVVRRRISASSWPRPATSKTLTRERVPWCTATADPGTPNAFANARLASSVALPPSGAARTRTTIPRPSRTTEARAAFGTTRTVTSPIPPCSIAPEGDDGNEYEGSRARASRGRCEPGGEAPPNIIPEPPPEPAATPAPPVDAAGSARNSGGLWTQPMSGRAGGPGNAGWYRGAHASSLQRGRGVRRFGGGDVRAGRSEGELPRARARGA